MILYIAITVHYSFVKVLFSEKVPGYERGLSLPESAMLLLNAFSLNLLSAFPASPTFTELTLEEVVKTLATSEWSSAVGHADTAAVFADALGTHVPCARVTVSLRIGNVAIIGQYRGPRLPEDASKLPEGATIQWIKMVV